MGRRPAGTGPRKDEGKWAKLSTSSHISGVNGLVSYGSDDEEDREDSQEEEGALPDGWREIVDKERQATYYWNGITMETTWTRPVADKPKKKKEKEEQKKKKEDAGGAAASGGAAEEEEEDEEVQRAALEAEDLFRSLESELTGDRQEQKKEKGEEEAVAEQKQEEGPPLTVEVLTEEELKKLTGGSKATALRDELRGLGQAVQGICGKRPRDCETRSRMWKLDARLEDWRDGLLPSSSLVRRLKELGQWIDSQQPQEEEEEEGEVGKGEGEEESSAASSSTNGTAPASVVVITAAAVPRPSTDQGADEEEDDGSSQKRARSGGSSSPSSVSSSPSAAEAAEWNAVWEPTHNAYYFYNSKTGETTWETPPSMTTASTSTSDQVHGTEGSADGSERSSTKEQAVEKPPRVLPFVETNTLIVFAGEHPEVTDLEGVAKCFPGCGRRDVRELGVNYYCVTFTSEQATALAVCVTNEGMDGEEAVGMAKSTWVRGRSGIFVRYPLEEDQPSQLSRVSVGFSTEGEGEEDAEKYLTTATEQYQQAAAAASSEPTAPVLKNGLAVVAGVVAKGPVLRRSAIASRAYSAIAKK